MDQVMESQSNIISALKNSAGSGASKENLFGLVLDLFKAAKGSAISSELEMCEDVLSQMVGYVEEEARARIAEKLASLDDAPRRVIQCLALEPIEIAKPILRQSPLLGDDDLVNVVRMCSPYHLEAVAERKIVTMPVTSELVRLGNTRIWERLAKNNGAQLADRSVAFLANRANENETIQLGLIGRSDLPESVVAKLISEAGETVREHLVKAGRSDLMVHLSKAESVVEKRVMSSAAVLGFEYDSAYDQVLRHEKIRPLKNADLLQSALRNDFPRSCAIFSILSGLNLEDSVHWLSLHEIEPAIVAFKVLNFEEELVSALLNTGPWKDILNDEIRQKALKALAKLKPDVAQRIFLERQNEFIQQQSAA